MAMRVPPGTAQLTGITGAVLRWIKWLTAIGARKEARRLRLHCPVAASL
jgi:hypothetical protein